MLGHITVYEYVYIHTYILVSWCVINDRRVEKKSCANTVQHRLNLSAQVIRQV